MRSATLSLTRALNALVHRWTKNLRQAAGKVDVLKKGMRVLVRAPTLMSRPRPPFDPGVQAVLFPGSPPGMRAVHPHTRHYEERERMQKRGNRRKGRSGWRPGFYGLFILRDFTGFYGRDQTDGTASRSSP